MTTNNEQQLFQAQNILETLLEATDHFANLLKQKEFNQCITIFNSIVEGSQAVMPMLNKTDTSFIPQSEILEKYLVMIVEELEKGNLLKVAEIVQFSLRPHYVQLQQKFIERLGNQEKDGPISIGVFHSRANPRDFSRKGRVTAMAEEAIKQNALLYFFTSKDIDFDNKTINGDIYKNEEWKTVTVPFPDVINNISAGRIAQSERRLRRQIPFTSFGVGNKFTLPKQMIKHKEYAHLLVPFQICKNEKSIYNFIERNNKVVFKELSSNRGENIYFVTKKGNRFVVLDHQKETIMNEEIFNQFIDNTILKEKDSYIIQKYIHTRTKEDEPYHIRAQVQKDRNGEWVLTYIYASVGNKQGNLSNLSSGGRNEDLNHYLVDQFGEKQGEQYDNKLRKLAIDIAVHLDKIYGFGIEELGIDLAIDDEGKIWMHEANNGPVTRYDEDKRAVHTIAYAKYIAKNGIMYTDSATKHAFRKGQFRAKKSSLPIADTSDKTAIGALNRYNTVDEMNEKLAKVSIEQNISFYSFHHRDIDFELGLIKGSFFESNKWIEMITEYPDVIIDRLNMRGHEDPEYIYEELDEIPFTNEYPVYNSARFSLYESIQDKHESAKHLPSYEAVDKLYRVVQFIENYESIRLVPNKFTSKYSTAVIESLGDNIYRIRKDGKVEERSMLTLRHAVQGMIEKEAYIVQEYPNIELSNGDHAEIHVYLMKNSKNNWSIISTNGQIKTIENDTIITNSVDVDEVLGDLFNANELAEVKNKINEVTTKLASALEYANTAPISELALSLAMNQEQKIIILEAFPGRFKYVHDENAYAEATIEYAKSLGEWNLEDMKQ